MIHWQKLKPQGLSMPWWDSEAKQRWSYESMGQSHKALHWATGFLPPPPLFFKWLRETLFWLLVKQICNPLTHTYSQKNKNKSWQSSANLYKNMQTIKHIPVVISSSAFWRAFFSFFSRSAFSLASLALRIFSCVSRILAFSFMARCTHAHTHTNCFKHRYWVQIEIIFQCLTKPFHVLPQCLESPLHNLSKHCSNAAMETDNSHHQRLEEWSEDD